MNEKYVLELKNVSYTYPERIAPTLNNLNLQVKQGEVVAIYGYNGCGKTTLLKVITNRCNEPYSGDVFINGEKINTDFDYTKIAYAAQKKEAEDAYYVRDELSNCNQYSQEAIE